jgi:hypothetical protein
LFGLVATGPPEPGLTGEDIAGGTDFSFPEPELSGAEPGPSPPCAEAHAVISSRMLMRVVR